MISHERLVQGALCKLRQCIAIYANSDSIGDEVQPSGDSNWCTCNTIEIASHDTCSAIPNPCDVIPHAGCDHTGKIAHERSSVSDVGHDHVVGLDETYQPAWRVTTRSARWQCVEDAGGSGLIRINVCPAFEGEGV